MQSLSQMLLLSISNPTTLKFNGLILLKTTVIIYFDNESANWTGLSRGGSSLFHMPSAGKVQLGAGGSISKMVHPYG